MSWNTKITKLLNIDYPIIQGAMAYISDGVLAAAMSHAGCAGVIGSGGFTPDEVQSHIRRFKDIAGSQKVYGVNLMLQDDNKDDIAQIICDEKSLLSLLAQVILSPGLNRSTKKESNVFPSFPM